MWSVLKTHTHFLLQSYKKKTWTYWVTVHFYSVFVPLLVVEILRSPKREPGYGRLQWVIWSATWFTPAQARHSWGIGLHLPHKLTALFWNHLRKAFLHLASFLWVVMPQIVSFEIIWEIIVFDIRLYLCDALKVYIFVNVLICSWRSWWPPPHKTAVIILLTLYILELLVHIVTYFCRYMYHCGQAVRWWKVEFS